jgi:hypothetical protein
VWSPTASALRPPTRPRSPPAPAIRSTWAGHYPWRFSHALATGFAHGFLAPAGIMLLTLAITIAVIRTRGTDVAGAPQAVTAMAAEQAPAR